MAAVVELVLGVTCLVCCLWTFRKWQLRQRLCRCLSPRVSSNQVQHSHMLKPRLEWMIGVCYNPPSFKQPLSFFVSVFVFVSICSCMLTLFLFPLNIVFVGLFSSVACTLPGCACWYLSCSITGISSEFGRIWQNSCGTLFHSQLGICVVWQSLRRCSNCRSPQYESSCQGLHTVCLFPTLGD